jgi:hypothetical protein
VLGLGSPPALALALVLARHSDQSSGAADTVPRGIHPLWHQPAVCGGRREQTDQPFWRLLLPPFTSVALGRALALAAGRLAHRRCRGCVPAAHRAGRCGVGRGADVASGVGPMWRRAWGRCCQIQLQGRCGQSGRNDALRDRVDLAQPQRHGRGRQQRFHRRRPERTAARERQVARRCAAAAAQRPATAAARENVSPQR